MAVKRGTKSPEEGAGQSPLSRALKTLMELEPSKATSAPTKVHGGLLAAYEGVLEDEIAYGYKSYVDAEEAAAKGQYAVAVQSLEQWGRDYATRAILADSPRKHLEVYLQWNGILGYSSIIWELAHGRYLV